VSCDQEVPGTYLFEERSLPGTAMVSSGNRTFG